MEIGIKRKKTVKSKKNINTLLGIREKIRGLLHDKPRDFLLFEMAIGSGLTAKSMLQLKVIDLKKLEPGEQLCIDDGKKKRIRRYTINSKTVEAFNRHLKKASLKESDYLFLSRKGKKPLTASSASRMINGWFKAIDIQNMSGFLSLRKIYEYHNKDQIKVSSINNEKANNKLAIDPLNFTSIQEAVYQKIERAIISGKITPGSKLLVTTLSKQFGVSDMPIRDSFSRLESRGFITVLRKKGAVVNELSKTKLLEILDIRLTLESKAVYNAMKFINSGIISQLEHYNNKYIESIKINDADQAIAMNYGFHFTLYEQSNMPILLNIIEDLWSRVSPYFHIMFRQTIRNNVRSGQKNHGKIIEAVKRRNSIKASEWIAQDISDSTKFVLEILDFVKTVETNK
jgi:DNA-binding GntR family transcriptional regulator